MGEALKRPLEDMFYLSDKLVSFLPTENFSLRLCQERELSLHLHVRVTLSLGRRKQRLALSSDQSGTKERARSPWLHPENRFMGNWFKKSQLHFRTVAYFSQHTLAAASWGGGEGGPAIILSPTSKLVPWCCVYAIKEFLKTAFTGIFACFSDLEIGSWLKHLSYVYFTFTKFKVQITIKDEMESINQRDILVVGHFKRTDGREEKLIKCYFFQSWN